MENKEFKETNPVEQSEICQDDNTLSVEEPENETAERSIKRGMCIDLRLEIGRVNVSLSKWNNVSEGSILILEGVKVGRAYLTDAEGVVAYGELLDVEGTIGFQIKRWRTI